MKIVTIVGARPQFIKATVVSRAIEKHNRQSPPRRAIREIWVHTGQHYDYLMNRVFFEELKIAKPDYDLGVGSGSHGKQTGIMIERIEAVLQREKPEAVIVYGDTNSTLAGGLAAAKLNVPVVHVEAGLRSYVRTMPEETNRLLTDHVSTFLFCPTDQAVKNLVREGIQPGRGKIVKNVGDVMYDSILYYSKLAEKKSTILKDLGLIKFKTHNSKPITFDYYLATLHRAENTDDPKKLASILRTLNELSKTVPVLLPLHPRTRKSMEAQRLTSKARKVKCIDPVSYLNMLMLEKHARAILTDSGGVQKEAYWLKVPCVTLRDETEWVETVKSGWNVLAGTEAQKILKALRSLERRKPSRGETDLFGDGKAGARIVRVLASHLQNRKELAGKTPFR